MIELDLHVHSRFSYDARQSVPKILETARDRGLDGVAITDHDSFEGSAEALQHSTEDLYVVPGIEVRTDDYDDLLALFVDGPIEPQPFVDAVDEIHARDGLAVLPHPYRKFDEVPERIVDSVDAIEGMNARSRSENNRRARRLGERSGHTMLGSSDAHTSREIGRGTTVVQTQSVDGPNDIKRAIEAGNVGYRGSESPYYLYHGASLLMEGINAIVD